MSLSPSSVNWTAFRGDDFSLNFQLCREDGAPIDITGWVFWFTGKQHSDAADVDASWQTEISTHLDPANGRTVLTIVNENGAGHLATADFLGGYHYDVQAMDTDGNVETYLSGMITFLRDITRSIIPTTTSTPTTTSSTTTVAVFQWTLIDDNPNGALWESSSGASLHCVMSGFPNGFWDNDPGNLTMQAAIDAAFAADPSPLPVPEFCVTVPSGLNWPAGWGWGTGGSLNH